MLTRQGCHLRRSFRSCPRQGCHLRRSFTQVVSMQDIHTYIDMVTPPVCMLYVMYVRLWLRTSSQLVVLGWLSGGVAVGCLDHSNHKTNNSYSACRLRFFHVVVVKYGLARVVVEVRTRVVVVFSSVRCCCRLYSFQFTHVVVVTTTIHLMIT